MSCVKMYAVVMSDTVGRVYLLLILGDFLDREPEVRELSWSNDSK